jgi:hypothetical protein
MESEGCLLALVEGAICFDARTLRSPTLKLWNAIERSDSAPDRFSRKALAVKKMK